MFDAKTRATRSAVFIAFLLGIDTTVPSPPALIVAASVVAATVITDPGYCQSAMVPSM